MTSVQPSPKTYTLRLKYNKTTVLVPCEATTTLDTIKKDLLTVLRQTNPDGQIHGTPLPQSHNAIRLAKPQDVNDLLKGWEGVEPIHGDADYVDDAAKKTKLNEVLKGASFKEHALMAFRFMDVETVSDEFPDDENWDVVVPSFDEAVDEAEVEAELPLRT